MKQKKRHKMMFGLWLGFMGLAGAMALLFWMVLHFSVKNKYQEQTENDLKMAAQSIWDMYGDADFEANIALLAKSNDYFVQIVSENSMQVVFSVNNQGERTAPQQADIADETMFERLNDSDGICQYYVEDQVHASRWAVQAVVLANLNGSRQVLVVSRSQANMDALMKLLTSRYLLVTVTVLILALILSVCLAEYFARPFRHLNKSALQMAAGDYETEFMREGPLEARQLADTLELAEQEFNKTEALRRDFVANVSHDMKTPLTVIRMYAEMLEAFSGERQEARILIRRYQGSVRVEVIDYGIGIEKDKLPYIWNRFYQAKPNDRQKSGMGVGLNIASEILRLHHAPFGAESTPNEGTCFWFMLEACEDET